MLAQGQRSRAAHSAASKLVAHRVVLARNIMPQPSPREAKWDVSTTVCEVGWFEGPLRGPAGGRAAVTPSLSFLTKL